LSRSSRHPPQRAWREAVSTGGAQQTRAEALIFTEHTQNGRHATDTVGNLGEELGRGARTQKAEMFGTALQAETVEGIKVDHAVAFQPRGVAPAAVVD
jgi:hypothetical protein